MTHTNKLPTLRINQRNTLRLIAKYEHRYPDEPCSLGEVKVSRGNAFMKAVNALEQKNLITVERNELSWNCWKVKLLIPPESILADS